MSESHPVGPGGQQPRANWILIGFIAIAAFFLITEHTAHVLGALPYVILLACPVLHFFMHHGHGDHRHRHDAEKEERK